MKKICIFGGASTGHNAQTVDGARRIGAMAASRGLGIVFGGGRVGMMGAFSDAAFQEGGYVHGVIPEFLKNLEVANTNISKLTVTLNMHERKTLMYEQSNAFLALPGGFGTMEEILEVITWQQLGIHDKPIMLFNTGGYWDSLTAMFHEASEAGFIRSRHLSLVDVAENLDDIADFFDRLAAGD